MGVALLALSVPLVTAAIDIRKIEAVWKGSRRAVGRANMALRRMV